jgi:hypothetical protein
VNESIFPFTLDSRASKSLFSAYSMANRHDLNENYGSWSLTGRGHEKLWSYYEVSVQVLSDTEVEFTTYGMYDSVYGGRGEPQEVIRHTYTGGELVKSVAQRKLAIASDVHHQRSVEELRRQTDAAIAAIHQELFGEPP